MLPFSHENVKAVKIIPLALYVFSTTFKFLGAVIVPLIILLFGTGSKTTSLFNLAYLVVSTSFIFNTKPVLSSFLVILVIINTLGAASVPLIDHTAKSTTGLFNPDCKVIVSLLPLLVMVLTISVLSSAIIVIV